MRHDDVSLSLLGETIQAIGAKKAARAMGYSIGYTYALARPAADPSHPDATGTELDPVARVESLLEVVSSYPSARPTLHRWRLHFDRLFDRLLDHREPRPRSHAEVIPLAAKCIREHGEAMAEAITDRDHPRALTECAEAMECMREMMDALQDVIDHEAAIPMNRRAS